MHPPNKFKIASRISYSWNAAKLDDRFNLDKRAFVDYLVDMVSEPECWEKFGDVLMGTGLECQLRMSGLVFDIAQSWVMEGKAVEI